MSNLPNDWHWNTPVGSHPWYTSHGSPSVQPNSIYMWASSNIGEGMNMSYNFKKNIEYCVDFNFYFTGSNITPPTSKINLILTPNTIVGTYSTGAPIPPYPSPNNIVWNPIFNTLPFNLWYH